MPYEKVLYAVRDGVARIAMNDPRTRNASSMQMGEELVDAFQRATGEARAVIFTGEGPAFNSGADLGGIDELMEDPLRDVGQALDRYFNPVIVAIREMELPVITAVRESGFFLQAFCHVGLVPDGGSSWLLARTVGRVRAMELMLLGERLPAAKALEWGLVNFVVPDDEVDTTAMNLARRLAGGPRSLGLIKRNAWAANDSTLENALSLERRGQREACRTDDFVEGVLAFKAKRQPLFKGR